MITVDQVRQVVNSLRFVTQLLNEGEELTDIELMAAFRRGIASVEKEIEYIGGQFLD